ncbi:MAG TPA: ATP-binding cassette domain-containing protein [Clostridia bacterium]|nr:ATP-binding cassette domain-containing protein [Clostridia bacterium]
MLELINISKKFNAGSINENTVFNNFNLKVNEGEFVSIVGSNGSGKTTILNIVSGNVPIDSGNIILNGRDITKQKEYVRAAKIGRVFQDPSKGTANTMTIAENMALADNKGKWYNLSIGLNSRRLGYYKEQLEQLNLGLEDRIGTKVGALSGGQRQALTLLIATMTPVDLLLLDEHTAALDPHISEDIMHLTKKLISAKKITTLMVTHNLRYAVEYGNRLLMLDKGKTIIDKSGEQKEVICVKELLATFNEISIECGN